MYSTILAESSTSKIPDVCGGRSTECDKTNCLKSEKDMFIVRAGLLSVRSASTTRFAIDRNVEVLAGVKPDSLQNLTTQINT